MAIARRAIRVVIADDHPVVRDGLRLTIERDAPDIEIVGEAADGQEVLALARTRGADVYVLDITMPNLNGLETARRLVRLDPEARAIVLSLHGSGALVEEAVRVGACGYLLKESATREVIEAIRKVRDGGVFFSRGLTGPVAERCAGPAAEAGDPAAAAALTPREREVLQLIAEGHLTKEIADRIGAAVNTVRVHRNSIMRKLGIHKETDLVRYAVREGIAKL